MGIKIKNLNYNINNNKILKNINIELKKNKFIGIIGPNGSGKTTILRHLYGGIKFSKGEISLDGKNIKKYSDREIAKKIAVLFQDTDMIFDYRVLDMVVMGRSPHKNLFELENQEDYEISMEKLDRVGLSEYYDRNYNTLSGGEKQRVLLARALAQEPEYLILDEPTNHLDINNQFQIMNKITKIDMTVIAAIHDLNIALFYCDYIYVLDEGEIIEHGKPRTILKSELINEVYEVTSKQIYDKGYGTYNLIYNPF